MQTFLPYPSFSESARVLDNRRLGKQRVECLQILNTLANGPYQKREAIIASWVSCTEEEWKYHKSGFSSYRRTPWYNHPAVRMWRGHEPALVVYLECVVTEWTSRGHKDTVWSTVLAKHRTHAMNRFMPFPPPWIGLPALHASHRSNLLRKLPSHYSAFGWIEPPNLPYIWPV